MATIRCVLMLCVLTGTVCLAWIDSLKQDADPTDCLGGNSVLTIGDVTLVYNSLAPGDFVILYFFAYDANTLVTVTNIYWTINFPIPLSLNQTVHEVLEPTSGFGLTMNPLRMNQVYNLDWVPCQIVLYSQPSDYATEIACWTGNLTLEPELLYCTEGNDQLSVSNVALNPSSPKTNESVYLSFTVESGYAYDLTFNSITWKLNFSSPVVSTYLISSYVTINDGETYNFYGNNVTLSQDVTPGLYSYQLAFYKDTTEVACWGGNVTVTQSSSYIYFLGLVGLSILILS